jgi:ATP-dependent DNA helicase RecQ
MGFDKPDLGFVVHLGAPNSPIAYYQQVGRAGRAVHHAEVLLLPGPEDQAIWRYFASLAFPPRAQVESVLDVLAESVRPLSTPVLEARVELRRSRLELMLKVLDVDGAVQRVKGGWVATGKPWTYDEARLQRVAEARRAEAALMLDYETTTACRMEFLRSALDDPAATRCGRCDNCTGTGLDSGTSETALSAARAFLGRPGIDLAPRRQWPTGLSLASGKIPPAEVAEPGRVLGRLSDLGWGDRLRRLLAPEVPDAAVPDDVVGAVVDVLKAWATGDGRWAARPTGVVSVGSTRHPVLIDSLATRIGEIGRLSVLGTVQAGGTDGGRANSAHRVKELFDRISVGADLAAELGSGPVLLVDDFVDSGWTMALAARALRQAGAPAVLPLALAQSA